MKLFFSAVLCFISFSFITAQQDNIADSNNVSAFKLFSELKKEQSGNLFYSPFSISTAMAMTYAGAKGNTEKQMHKTLHFSSSQDSFHVQYKAYLQKLGTDTGKGLTLKMANSIWVANDCKVVHHFTEVIKSDYHSELENVGFAGQPEPVRQGINTWVEHKTNNKIKDLIPAGMITAATRMVLVNAIYFKGKWNIPFSKDSTRVEDFHYSIHTDFKTAFMHNTAYYGYYEDANIQAIQIPYAGDKISMVILLPKSINGIAGLRQQINYTYYKSVVSSIHPKEVILTMPKFKSSGMFELSKALSAMGMPDAFTATADFSGMAKENIAIGAVVHKAYVDVNEEGTEAAAATGVTMKAMAAAPMPPVVFTADHPFIFVIKDNATGSILFIGTLMDPRK